LERHWLASAEQSYGSLHEVLFRFGFRPPNWLTHFDAASYISYNYLWGSVSNSTQALVHFITKGVRENLAISEDLEFDAAFVRETQDVPREAPDGALYKYWVEWMLSAHKREGAFPPNEAAMLHRIGLRLSSVPKEFDWRRYHAERPAIAESAGRTRLAAINYFIETGIVEPHPVPMPRHLAEPLLRAAADRFAERNVLDKARIAYDRYLLCPNATGRGIQHAADLEFRERNFARALFLYNNVRARSQANLWTFVNAASSAHELREFETAQEQIEEGLRLYPRSLHLQRCFHDLQNSVFNLAVTRHVNMLREGEPEASSLGRDVAGIYSAFRNFYEIQYPGGAKKTRRHGVTPDTIVIAMLANCDLPQCTYYRVTEKAAHLSAIGVQIRVFTLDQISGFLTAASTADCAIFYRLAASAATLHCLSYCHHLGIPVAYEIDDLVFDAAHFPDALESYGGTITAEKHFELRSGVALVTSLMALCDYGIASTEGLRSQIAKIVKTGEVMVHRNVLSHELRAIAESPAHAAANRRGSVTIFYGSGTLAHARDFKTQIEPALLRLMKQNPDVRFMACGHVDVAALEEAFPARVALVEFIADRSEYLKLLAAADINIAVLDANRFNDCKSEIKWLEAAAFGVPSIVSDVAVYHENLKHGEDVVITAPDEQAWYKALKALVAAPRKRAEIGARAQVRAAELYDPGMAAQTLAAGLCKWACGAAMPAHGAAKRRQRVLVVNVFFPPQAIGGATRIVAAQVLKMREVYADKFDVAVFCGNDEDGVPYEMTAYEWNGVPVYSVNTPLREGNDWQYADPGIRPGFEAVLDRYKPDIVHFHAIQRLTAVVIDALLDRGIPYVVTVHDAWWISDHQFLIDQDDRLEMPWERNAERMNGSCKTASSETRLRELAARLKGANAVLAVSASFTTLYQRAGIANVRTVENGLPELPKLEAAAAPEGVLRIGHFGGRGYIKGLFLLKRALSRGAYAKLEAVVVDLSKSWGEEVLEVWGETPVRIVGRVPQDKIGWLYGQIDVLIAPSVWPESFGLVVREAVLYGKWVVVSDRGALPEAVIPGVNGFVIDLNDPQALPAILGRLQAEMKRFRATPAQAPRIATVAENTGAVCAIYDEILAAPAKLAASKRPPARRQTFERVLGAS
jgi:glycosyltransferase involved in cell wall biosynthesis